MLKLVLSIVVAAVSTTALPASYWITEHIWKIDQSPLAENAASLDSAAPSFDFSAPPQEQLSDLDASSDDPVSQAWSATFPQEQLSELDASSDDPVFQAWTAKFPLPATYPQGDPSSLAKSNSISLVYQFKEIATLENVAARSNGDLLLTATCHAEVYSMTPKSKGKVTPNKICTFPGFNASLGIAETAPDVFAVAVGNYTPSFAGVDGTFGVWSVDLTQNANMPKTRNITGIPEAGALNGMAALREHSDVVLIADSGLGAIWRVNTTSGEYDKAAEHVLFSSCGSPFPLGINGISVVDDYLYFINSAQQLYGRVAIDKTGSAIAEPEIIARSPRTAAWDDMAMDWAGNAWIATHANAVTEVTLDGKQRNFTGKDDKTEMMQPTSIVFGRGSPEAEKMLYVVTAGSESDTGPPTPGQVFSLDTRMV